jgi:hypothetical protein
MQTKVNMQVEYASRICLMSLLLVRAAPSLAPATSAFRCLQPAVGGRDLRRSLEEEMVSGAGKKRGDG